MIKPLLLCVAAAVLLGGCGGAPDAAAASGAASSAGSADRVDASTGPARKTDNLSFITSDGITLHAKLSYSGTLQARPLIVEFSPYSGNGIPDFGARYNHVFVHARGSGESGGSWSAVGPLDQRDVAELLQWACAQPWSNGHIGLYGFSASAIAVYNSLHQPLACVDAAALMAGTHELYRDLLYPGGMTNVLPAIAVGLGVGGPLLASIPQRLATGENISPLPPAIGMGGILANLLLHPTLDAYWQARTQRPGPNRFPVLADTGFYDVESRGPFESYRALRAQGVPVHLRVFGAHDGFPADTPGPFVEYQRWFDRFLLGENNGIDQEPRVQMLIGIGGYQAQINGAVKHYSASDWPVPGTQWQTLFLNADQRLTDHPASTSDKQSYLALTSGLATDPYTTATVAPISPLADLLSGVLTAGPQSLHYTSDALQTAVDIVGPASLILHAASLLPEADFHAVLSDVWPDGSVHPVGAGRLRSSFPHLLTERTLYNARGEPIQPTADFSAKDRARPGQMREYAIEFWPIGNRFETGHRLRLSLVAAPSYDLTLPGGLITVGLGGITPSRLLLPVLPHNDLCAALGSAC